MKINMDTKAIKRVLEEVRREEFAVEHKDKILKIYDIVKPSNAKNKNFTEKELKLELHRFYFEALEKIDTPKHFNEYVNSYWDYLFKEKTYCSQFILEGCNQFPENLTIGGIRVINTNQIDTELKKTIEFLNKHKKIFVGSFSIAETEFKTYRTVGISDVLIDLIRIPYAFISILNHFVKLDPQNIIAIIKDPYRESTVQFGPIVEPRSFCLFDETQVKNYELVNKILKKPDKSSLYRRIIRSVNLYGLTSSTSDNSIKFLMIISALESLLLSKNDKDFLGTKLAEKASFLNFEETGKRIAFFKKVKKMYGERSDFVHGSILKVSETTYKQALEIYKNTILKIIKLSDTYQKMEMKEKESQSPGLEDYFLELKFT